jgi:hypothetical protein
MPTGRSILDPMPIACDLLVAAREEVNLLATDRVGELDSSAHAVRLIGRTPIRLTPRAAHLVALAPQGGYHSRVIALLNAGRLVLIQRYIERPSAPASVRRQRGSEPPPELTAAAGAGATRLSEQTAWIKFQVVHHVTGEPFVGVHLAVRTPGGLEVFVQTGADGGAMVRDIEPGACSVWCPLENARLAQTVAFVGMGAPVAQDGGAPDVSSRSAEAAEAEWIAHIAEHHVKSGETLANIAASNDMSWKELAEFNWGTSNPDEINQHLRDDVGCSEKTPDGFNYRFTSEDEPGLLYVPRPWSQEGLATEQTHVIRVRLAAGFRLILESIDKQRIPEAEYEVTLADGSVRTGRLGRSGVALIKDPPPGDVEVVYTNLDDIEAKSLAAAARQAFDDRDPLEIHRLFRYPRETIRRAFKAYEQYYNTYHGKGLRGDIEEEFGADEEASVLFFAYMGAAGQPGAIEDETYTEEGVSVEEAPRG